MSLVTVTTVHTIQQMAPLRRVVVAAVVLCTTAHAYALQEGRSALVDDIEEASLTWRQEVYESPGVVDHVIEEAEAGTAVDEAGDMMDVSSSRSLLHGCHGLRCSSSLPVCPRCRFPSSRGSQGHCKRRLQRHNCFRRNGAGVSRFVANDGFGGIGPAECPSIHALSSPGGFDLPADFTYDDGSDYEEEDVAEEDVSDGYAFEDRSLEFEMRLFQPPAFAAVSTPGELRRALRRGVNHIVLIQHMDLIDAKTEPDLPRQMEALDNAVGRVLNTTLSIVGMCDGPPPEEFTLTEPLPTGACAVRVREDFLDAPIGTTCLLIDSLYMLVAPGGDVVTSSTLILHIDGLMWIANCVFQGAGLNGRAIDTNTGLGLIAGRQRAPALFIQDTTFTGFTRSLAPGIRARPGSRLWLNNCVFREITLIPPDPGLQLPPEKRVSIQATAIAAENNVELVLVNTTIEDNVVLGQPAGDQAVAISLVETEIFASPQMRVWVWPEGPFVMSAPEVEVAEAVINSVARPVLRSIQDITQDIITRGLQQVESSPGEKD